MENDETTVENKDCEFVDIGGVKQSLSHENRSWKFCNSVSVPSAEVVFFTQVCFSFSHKSVFCFDFDIFFNLISLSISKLTFYHLSCDETAIWLSILSGIAGYMLPNPKL